MKRLTVFAAVAMALAFPVSAGAFHHGGLPSTTCSAEAAGDPSNTNGEARENLTRVGLFPPALPPVGTPGEGQGEGEHHCATSTAP